MDSTSSPGLPAQAAASDFSTHQSGDEAPAATPLLIMLVSGNEDSGKRATLAFSAACSAAALNQPTSVFLVGDGIRWGYNRHIDNVKVTGFPALRDLVEIFTDLGGKLVVCSACSMSGSACSLDDGDSLERARMRPDVSLQGFASVLDYVRHGTTLTF